MALPQSQPQKQPAGLETVAATRALALCAVAYYLYSLSRYMALRTSEMLFDNIFRLATSPAEVALLTMLALWFISWSLDRHTKAAQLFSSLNFRLLGALIVAQSPPPKAAAAAAAAAEAPCQQQQQQPATKAQAGGKPARRAALPAAPGGTAAALGSPSKGIASFRLPEHSYYSKSGGSRRAAAAAAAGAPRQRWSVDMPPRHPGSGQLGIQPKPRTSVDFDVAAGTAPSSPVRRARGGGGGGGGGGSQRRSRRSAADHHSAPVLDAAGSSSGAASGAGSQQSAAAAAAAAQPRKWQPRMQRIASGQELADLAASRRSVDSVHSTDGSPTSTAAAAAATDSLAAATAAGAAAAAAATDSAPAALSSWLPAGWSPFASTSTPTTPSNNLSSGSGSGSAVDASDVGDGALPELTSPSSATAAAVGAWVASTSTACAAWASSTVDTVLRPLIPSASLPIPLPLDTLWRSPSAPLPNQAQQQQQQAGAAGGGGSAGSGAAHATGSESSPLQFPCLSMPIPNESAAAARRASSSAAGDHSYACDRRRQSIDGVSARHYTQGGVTADPNRKQALENLACAARLQSCSALAALGGGTAPPGHLSVASGSSCGGSGSAAPLGAGAGSSALASVGLDGDCPQEIRDHVTDEHLLQFAAVVGEEASSAAAAELALPPAWGAGGSLLGEAAECSHENWEQVIERTVEGLSYEAWRQPLRGGLYMYRTRAFFHDVSPKDLRPFHLDDHARHLWDENVIEIRRVKPASDTRLHKHSEWCLHHYRSRFPRPLAAREYQYARRVWHRPSDGGCYVVCRGQALPDAGDGYRAVKVTDIVSCCVIREAPGGAELLSLYFEDSAVRPSLAKMAVKGMWGYMQKYEAALRVFAEARQAAAAEYAAGGSGAAPGSARRRGSLDGGAGPAARPRRRSLLQQVCEDGAAAEEAGSSSGDDATLRGAYAAMRRQLHRGASRLGGSAHGGGGGGGGGGGSKRAQARWAGRLVVLAGIKMVHTILTSPTRR